MTKQEATVEKRDGQAVLETAKRAIDKARKDSLEGKLKELMKKRLEHERSISQLDEEMNREIAAYEAGQ